MENNVCLYLKERYLKQNQLIQGFNFFLDGSSGQFNDLSNINTDMDNPAIDNLLFVASGASMQLNMNALGSVVVEGDSLITLNPNEEYYIVAYVYEAIDPPPIIDVNYFIDIAKTGWSDSTFTTIERYQLKVGTEGNWNRLVAKMVTGVDTSGKIQLLQSGSELGLVDGELFHIDSISISAFIPYIGTTVHYKHEVCLPVESNIDASILYKIRDLTKPNFLFQRAKTRTVSIPSTKETEDYFRFSHRTGSVRGEKSFQAEYIGRLEVDGIEVLSGLFTLDELLALSCKEKSYKGKIISDSRVWTSLLSEFDLCDLDWSEYAFLFSINNIESTWLNNGDNSNFVIYPFELREIPTVLADTYKIFSDQFSMGHFIKPFLRKIFRHIGYELIFKGDFVNGNYFRDIFIQGATLPKYVSSVDYEAIYEGYFLGNEKIEVGETETPNYEDSEFDPNNYINTNTVEKVVGFELVMSLHFETWSGTSYDSPEGNVFYSLPAISAYDGQVIKVRAEFIFDVILAASTDHAYFIKIEFYTGVSTVIDTQYIYDSNEPLWFTDGFVIDLVTNLGNGDYQIDFHDGGGSYTHFFGASMMIGTGDAEFYARLRKPADDLDKGFNISQDGYCENMFDIVSSIAGCFNLMHLTDENKKTITLTQRDDFYKLGSNAIDVEQLAVEGEISQIRLGKRNSKDFDFSYIENPTDIWFAEVAPNNFGNSSFNNKNGNSSIETIKMNEGNVFSATMNWESVVGLWLPRYQHEVGGIVQLGLKLFHYDGLIALTPPSEMEITTREYLVGTPIVSKTFSSYPRATFSAETGFGTTNLAFHDYKDNQGLVNVHWIKELEIISNARLLTASFYLNVDFIRKLDYSRFWKFQDVLFILNGIIDFKYIEKGNTKVELITLNTFYG